MRTNSKVLKMNKKTLLIISACLICLVIAAIVFFVLFFGGSKEKSADIEIDTKYCTLHYPSQWEKYLSTDIIEEPYTVSFFAQVDNKEKQKLFDVCFGEASDNSVGTIKSGKSTVYVSFVPADIPYEKNATPDETDNIIFAMLDDMNYTVDKLTKEESFSDVLYDAAATPDQPVETNSVETVDTPYSKLEYSSRWKDKMTVKTDDKDDYTVEFFAKSGNAAEIHLFDIMFGTAKEPALTIKTSDKKSVDVIIKLYELKFDESLSQNEKDTLYTMQEEVNNILDRLQKSQ